MIIDKMKNENSLTLILTGRLDTATSPELESEIKASIDGITSLKLDFIRLQYIASAGLRVLLSAQKIMNRQGEMIVCGVNDEVMEIFEITGFSDILTIL